MGSSERIRKADAMCRCKRLALRLRARVGSKTAYIESPHRTHCDFAAAFRGDCGRESGAHFAILQTSFRWTVQHSESGNGFIEGRVHKSASDPLLLPPMHNGPRNGSSPRVSRLVPFPRHEMARSTADWECCAPTVSSCCRFSGLTCSRPTFRAPGQLYIPRRPAPASNGYVRGIGILRSSGSYRSA